MSLYLFILAIFTTCSNPNTTEQNSEKVSPVEEVQPEQDIVDLDDEAQQIIVGKFTKEELQQGQYATWFNTAYEEFTPDSEDMQEIKNNISGYEIVGFIGTWCPDSRRELPKFFKILDEAGFDHSQLTMVGVTRGKITPENLEEGYDMTRVPTFIFLKDGKEVNRYVEYAGESIEADIAKIVSGKEYKHSYFN